MNTLKDTQDLYQIVYEHYANKIRFGLYREGDSLPTIEKISGQDVYKRQPHTRAD